MKLLTFWLFTIFIGACVALPTRTTGTVKPVLDKLDKELDVEHAKIMKQNDMKALNKSLHDFKIQFNKAKTNYDDFEKKYNVADKGLKQHMLEYQEEKNLIHNL